MLKQNLLFILICLGTIKGYSQSSIDLIATGGFSFSDKVNYMGCTGTVDPAFVFSLSFVYHPDRIIGFEVNYLYEQPTTYLDDQHDNSVKIYTSTNVTISRFLGGVNFQLPNKRLRPFAGVLLGVTQVETSDIINTGEYTGFTWSLQGGADLNISSLLAIRAKFSYVQTPNVSNNSAYFGVKGNGDGFPTFALGEPSTANISQINLSLGIVFHIRLKSRK